MGWIGFGLGMGFRTARYTRYAVRSTIRSGRRRNCRPSTRVYVPSNSRHADKLPAIFFAVLVALFIIIMVISSTPAATTTNTYGPPGRYGYGFDSGTRRIIALNTPPGTQLTPGQHTVFRITLQPPPAKPTPQKTHAFNYILISGYVLVLLAIFYVLAQFRPSRRNARSTNPPTPEQPDGPLGFPLGPDGPLNPRMYYSNRR